MHELRVRQAKLEARRKRVANYNQDVANTLQMQLDALHCLSCGKFYINPNDRQTLLTFLSSLPSHRMLFEPSPLTVPTMQLADLAWKRDPQGNSDMPASGSNDPKLDAVLTRTISYAHKHKLRQKAQALTKPPAGPSLAQPAWRQAPLILGQESRSTASTPSLLQRNIQKEFALRHTHKLLRQQERERASEGYRKEERMRQMMEAVKKEVATPTPKVDPKRESSVGYIDQTVVERVNARREEIFAMEDDAMLTDIEMVQKLRLERLELSKQSGAD